MEDRNWRRVSQIKEDQTRIVAVYGPLGKDLVSKFLVRGVEVQRFDITQMNARGQHYRLCRFPDGREMWVNEGNLIPHRRPAQYMGDK
jgi:hypothetical protein